MKLTSQEEYGLRCILSLARVEGEPRLGEPPHEGGVFAAAPQPFLTTQDIARREGLSVQYTGKLIRILGRAGLIESVRGCKGGYRLARPAERISVAETLAALGGKIYEKGTCERYTGDRKFCVHTNDCSIRSLWAGIQILIDQVLSRTTLRDLVMTGERTTAQVIGVSAMGSNSPPPAPPEGGRWPGREPLRNSPPPAPPEGGRWPGRVSPSESGDRAEDRTPEGRESRTG